MRVRIQTCDFCSLNSDVVQAQEGMVFVYIFLTNCILKVPSSVFKLTPFLSKHPASNLVCWAFIPCWAATSYNTSYNIHSKKRWYRTNIKMVFGKIVCKNQ